MTNEEQSDHGGIRGHIYNVNKYIVTVDTEWTKHYYDVENHCHFNLTHSSPRISGANGCL